MGLYETTFIVNPQTDDTTIDRKVKAIVEIITEAGGKVVYENRMGTRRMAYAINKLTQGYYANFIFEAPKTVVPQLDRHMRLDEAYMRHLTVVFEGTVPDKDASPAPMDDFRHRPHRGRPDRPYGRREGGRDRGRPESPRPAEGKPAPAESKAAVAPPAAPPAATPPAAAPPATAPPATAAPVTPPAPAVAPAAPPPAPAAAPVTPEPAAPPAEPVAPAVEETAPTPPPVEAEPVKPPTPPTPSATESEPAEEETYREEEEL
jgi:ribosomal protein S6